MNLRIITTCIFLIAVGFTSCKNSQNHSIDNKATFNDTSIAVINDTMQAKFYVGDYTLWSPTQNQIIIIDSIMRESTSDTLMVDRILDFNKYYKQYICYIDASGDSIIYISGFCQIPSAPVRDSTMNWKLTPHDWKHNFLRVDDGGRCFWQMRINFTKKKYSDYTINGYA
jgi:hypothetical protein